MAIRTFFRYVAWLLVVAVAIFTLLPIELRPVTAAPADLERIAAFGLIGATFCLAYPRHRAAIVLLVVGIAGLLEVLQHVALGRHSRIHDFDVKALAAIAGIVLAGAAERILVHRLRPSMT